jgi:hypothetical protein
MTAITFRSVVVHPLHQVGDWVLLVLLTPVVIPFVVVEVVRDYRRQHQQRKGEIIEEKVSERPRFMLE